MEITLQDFERQLEIVRTYKDDKFASLLKKCADAMKAQAEGQLALDARQKKVAEAEKLCEVIQGSQAEFNRWKSAEEAKIAASRARNQMAKDTATSELKIAREERAEAAEYKLASEGMLQEAEKTLKSAENKDKKAEKALADALEAKAGWEKRLAELGLKAA